MSPSHPRWSRLGWFVFGFSSYTIATGIWAVGQGVAFWKIMPGCLIAGVAGGLTLSVAMNLLQTGSMQRGGSFYRFSERPVSFVMDVIMIVLGLLLCGLWPLGYALQELREEEPNHERTSVGDPATRSESDGYPPAA